VSQRADRIKREVPLDKILSEYGYAVYQGGGEQQFSCDLHGDGSDSSPSARFYPESNSFYCFACGKARDSISLVMEKEGLEFPQACQAIEKKYGLSEWVYQKKKDIFQEDEVADPSEIEIISQSVYRRLTWVTKERSIEYSLALRLWEGYDLLTSLEKSSKAQWRKLIEMIPKEV